VVIPSGVSKVAFRYAPRSVYIGAVLSVVSWLPVAWLAWLAESR
jgi:hypothetical protein